MPERVGYRDQDHSVTVRPATVADHVALAELNVVVQQMHHEVAPEWFKPPEMAATIDYFREALLSDAVRTFVAEVDGAVRGYACPASAAARDRHNLRWPRRRTRPDQRRSGVSRARPRETAHRPGDVAGLRCRSVSPAVDGVGVQQARTGSLRASRIRSDDDKDGREQLSQRHQAGDQGRPADVEVAVVMGRE